MFMDRKRRRQRGRKRVGQKIMSQIIKAQATEETEAVIYSKLARWTKEKKNRQILETISNEEKKHALYWKGHTHKEIRAKPFKIFFHTLVAKLLGLTFSVKLMEKGEESAQINYNEIAKEIPQAKEIKAEENAHELKLLGMLDEERLKYVGSMILGVNDALVELTGALAGFTLALQNTRLIAVIGLITGIAASLSMAASEYLSTKAESQDKDPLKASIYTGVMYLVTVILLVLPYYLFPNVYAALATTLLIAILIILFFTFYISVAQDLPFKKRFSEMAGISMGVSALTFGIGFLVKKFFGGGV
ncbi:MAG: hypothetical protein UT39_C0021G0012 [Candidatus Woesebacteria bacterium GW2011_GWA1_39_21]|uniref:Rubrerythrin diiron-binding domain-containing protein n=1 Tax=Candidatus Woesebacteria bacterium GW2011_GWA1_39_21 TaxID=1618550 RepID=A0A0G0QIM7_9BACT|nr:MAG: hypothetical protein UT39_C0021G0012 [Candidatus Woesebacteria bacterium GW2011_GWA1_39_21]